MREEVVQAVDRAAIAQPQQNFDNVQIRVLPVQGNVYLVAGTGGNITLQVGKEGVLMVDTEFAPLAPKIMAVPVGSTVSFATFDAIYHNVFSRNDVQPFDLGIYKNGQSRDVTFEKEGILRLGIP